jgi:hypothetical protein
VRALQVRCTSVPPGRRNRRRERSREDYQGCLDQSSSRGRGTRRTGGDGTQSSDICHIRERTPLARGRVADVVEAVGAGQEEEAVAGGVNVVVRALRVAAEP